MKDKMIPVGYMAKRVQNTSGEFNNKEIVDTYSVSGCLSANFADYTEFWKHNGYWFFDSPEIIRQISKEHAVDLTGTTMFYYEAFNMEFDDESGWRQFEPDAYFITNIEQPQSRRLEGYDVVTYSCGYNAECSPLSCNWLANTIQVNKHCLLPSIENACQLLEDGKFHHSEPGPYRIIAVYSVMSLELTSNIKMQVYVHLFTYNTNYLLINQ